MPIDIECRPDGPLRVKGPFTLLDEHGVPIPLPEGKPHISLCRCGLSKTKPFCDGAHKTGGFKAP
jgi:CDGSH-type Zn-finger protein